LLLFKIILILYSDIKSIQYMCCALDKFGTDGE